MKHYDVIIAGGGMVGSSLACLLAKAGVQVAVIEAFTPQAFKESNPHDLRVSAISPFSQNVLSNAGAWPFMQAMRVSPYEKMHVWDSTGDGEIHFDAADIGEPQLGHIIENRVIQLALIQTLQQTESATLICPARLENFTIENKNVLVTLDNGDELSATLLVGADGANSQVREISKIPVERNAYGQHGLVTVVETEKSHEDTAWQRFLPSGPVAFLPLNKNQCSIVWTLSSDKSDYMLSLDDDSFKQELAKALDNKLGKITHIEQRAAFPLRGSQASAYVQENIALIGDAAHTIHPLAGLGVNLGIKDAAKLAEILLSSTPDKFARYKLLRRYERARRGDNLITMKAMEAFRALFGNDLDPVKTLRNVGLSWINQRSSIKNTFIRQAMGG